MSNVIEIEGLRKVYRRWRKPPVVAVSHLDLAIPEGGVYGFLGPNGSGKTTTIRCLLGFVRASGGQIAMLNAPVPGGLDDAMRSVGAVVETPSLFPTMTARENLRLLGAIDNISSRQVDDMLGVVGLGEQGGQLVKRYSLGMRQRLGLAAALLKDPALLILDEPANGLDPAGIRDTRRLLRRIGDEGRTVFLSSHLLAEIEQTCDGVTVIHHGRRLVSGGVREVLAAAQPSCVNVRVDSASPDAAFDVLSRAGFAAELRGDLVRVAVDLSRTSDITRTLAAGGLWIASLEREEATLEDYFLDLTQGGLQEVGA